MARNLSDLSDFIGGEAAGEDAPAGTRFRKGLGTTGGALAKLRAKREAEAAEKKSATKTARSGVPDRDPPGAPGSMDPGEDLDVHAEAAVEIERILPHISNGDAKKFLSRCMEHLEQAVAGADQLAERIEMLRESREPICRFRAAVLAEQLGYFEPEFDHVAEEIYRETLDIFEREGKSEGVRLIQEELGLIEDSLEDELSLPMEDDTLEKAANLRENGELIEAAKVFLRLAENEEALESLRLHAERENNRAPGLIVENLPVYEYALSKSEDPGLVDLLMKISRSYLDCEKDSTMENRREAVMGLAGEMAREKQMVRELAAAAERARHEEIHGARGHRGRGSSSMGGLLGGLILDAAIGTGASHSGGGGLFEAVMDSAFGSSYGGYGGMSSEQLRLQMIAAQNDAAMKEKLLDLAQQQISKQKEGMTIGDRKMKAVEFLFRHTPAADTAYLELTRRYMELLEENYVFEGAARIAEAIKDPEKAEAYLEADRIIDHATIGDPRRELMVTERNVDLLFWRIYKHEIVL